MKRIKRKIPSLWFSEPRHTHAIKIPATGVMLFNPSVLGVLTETKSHIAAHSLPLPPRWARQENQGEKCKNPGLR